MRWEPTPKFVPLCDRAHFLSITTVVTIISMELFFFQGQLWRIPLCEHYTTRLKFWTVSCHLHLGQFLTPKLHFSFSYSWPFLHLSEVVFLKECFICNFSSSIIGKANPCQAADQYMQCVYQMIDNQVYNSNLTSDFAFIEALDNRNFYVIGGSYHFLPVSALQPRALMIEVVMLTFNVSPIYTTYCMAVLFTRFIIKHLGFQPISSCTSINSWTAKPLCPYFNGVNFWADVALSITFLAVLIFLPTAQIDDKGRNWVKDTT